MKKNKEDESLSTVKRNPLESATITILVAISQDSKLRIPTWIADFLFATNLQSVTSIDIPEKYYSLFIPLGFQFAFILSFFFSFERSNLRSNGSNKVNSFFFLYDPIRITGKEIRKWRTWYGPYNKNWETWNFICVWACLKKNWADFELISRKNKTKKSFLLKNTQDGHSSMFNKKY